MCLRETQGEPACTDTTHSHSQLRSAHLPELTKETSAHTHTRTHVHRHIMDTHL